MAREGRHPRLRCDQASKTWMPGPRPGMTANKCARPSPTRPWGALAGNPAL